MKYLIRLLVWSLLLTMTMACSNAGGKSPEMRKSEVRYGDLHIYRGSPAGAVEVPIDTVRMDTTWKTIDKTQEDGTIVKDKVVEKIDTVYLNVDSLYTTLVISRYFGSIYSMEIKDRNNIWFEFLDDAGDMLRYVGENSQGRRATIISSYEYDGDTLNILEGGTTPVFVAIKAEKTGEFYRTLGLVLPKLITETEGGLINNHPLKPEDKVEFTLESALRAVGYDDPATFTNEGDSVIWCNLKYIYR